VPFDLRRPPSGRGAPAYLDSLDAAAARMARRRLAVAAGRAVLWTVLAFVALRGVTDLLGNEDVPARVVAAGAAPAWPDDEAQAFALRFARAYLSRSRRYPGVERQTVAAMAAPELRDALTVSVPSRVRPQAVPEVSVARVVGLDRDRALVTVACTVLGRSISTRYLAVPVARDAAGGLIVFDLPSFTSPPRPANAPRLAQREPLEGSEADAVNALVRRFLAAYLAGDREQLPFVMARDAVPPAPLGERYQLVDLERVQRLDHARVTAVARVRESESRAVYTLRYRLRLKRTDRWLVLGVEG